MLSQRQSVVLVICAVLFWAAATAWIRLVPSSQLSWRGDAGFLASIPLCWCCILLVQRAARLTPAQLVPGAALVVAAATLIDASALRWAPSLYGVDDPLLRLGAAWLLWGYGVTLAIALLISMRATKGLQSNPQCR